MDLAVNIAIGSSAQIALFVAPVLVIASFFIGVGPDAAGLQRLRARRGAARDPGRQLVTHDGESNWFEGVQLLALYAILGDRLLLRLSGSRARVGRRWKYVLLAAASR